MLDSKEWMEQFEIPHGVGRVLDVLRNAGFEGWLVGGCVRDRLMGRTPKDFDVATDAPAGMVAAAFAGFRVIETGLKHGTVTVLSDGMPVEVTTFRVDGAYSDGRHPDSVTFTSDIRDDLSRRDFTVNAMAYSPARGFLDEFGGRNDLRDKVGASARTRCGSSARCALPPVWAFPSSLPPPTRFTAAEGFSGRSPSSASHRSFSAFSAAATRVTL